MEDEQQTPPFGKRIARRIRQRPGTTVGGGLLLVACVIFFYWVIFTDGSPPWTGFRTRTLWDWLGLFGVAAAGSWLIWAQKERESKSAEKAQEKDWELAEKARAGEREIADSRQKQATLEAYYDRMTKLLLKRGLRESEADSEVRNIARARTVAAVKSLDGERNGQLFAFLRALKLMEPKQPIIDPVNIDFSGVDMSGIYLSRANLGGADLRRADLSRADLHRTDLGVANLRRANLSWADLSWANLSWADLFEATLFEANLYQANLRRAELRKAGFRGANLFGVDLHEAENWTIEQFDEAKTLEGATMPDGVKLGDSENDGPTYAEWKAQYLAKQNASGVGL